MGRVSVCTLAVLCGVNLLYIILGGVCFHYLENPNHLAIRDSVQATTQDFLARHPCLADEDLDTFLRSLGVERGLDHAGWDDWDLSFAIFFSTNIVSTVGYGKAAPRTTGGRMFCVCFAVVGVPLFLLTTGLLGERAAGAVCRLDTCLDAGPLRDRRTAIKVTRTLGYAAVGALFFLLLTAGVVTAMGALSFGESLFYMYSILSTIGYGDFEPVALSTTQHTIYRVLIGFWIFLGLTWMFSMVGLLIDFFGIIITIRPEEAKAPSDTEDNWLISAGSSLDSLTSDSTSQYRSILLR